MNETERMDRESRIREDNDEAMYPGLMVRVPANDLRDMHAAIKVLRAALRTDYLDPQGSKHTDGCLLKRRAGIPSCTEECRTIRDAVARVAHLTIPGYGATYGEGGDA